MKEKKKKELVDKFTYGIGLLIDIFQKHFILKIPLRLWKKLNMDEKNSLLMGLLVSEQEKK